ncbi:MAG: flippase-like domain-containing protein [Sedimentisphaerales bacterium]|nr:flippase-like domain-containing protein [Sedimentisphaerales bacterium]
MKIQLKKIIKLLIATVCIIYLVRFFWTNTDSLKLLAKINIFALVLLGVLSAGYILLYSYRFQLILEKCSGQKLPFFPWLKILVLGRFLNMVFSQLGTVYRGVSLKRNHNISYTSYISGFASFAWMDTCMNMIIAIIVILLIRPDLKIGQFSALKVTIYLCSLVILAPLIAHIILQKIKFKKQSLAWLRSKLAEVLTTTIHNLRDGVYLTKIVILGMLVFAETILSFYILFASFGIKLDLATLTVFFVLLKLSVFINITPGNIGIQEVAYGFLSEQMGIGMAQGILASVVARLLSSLVVFVLGLMFGGAELLRHRKEYRNSLE